MVFNGIEYKEISDLEDVMKDYKRGDIKKLCKKFKLSFPMVDSGFISDEEFMTLQKRKTEDKEKKSKSKSNDMKRVWKEKEEGTFVPKNKKRPVKKPTTDK